MKVLCLTRNYEYWTAFGEYEYLKELTRQADVTFIGVGYDGYKPNMDLKEYTRDEGYDVIYYSQCTTENPGDFASVAETSIPKVAYMHDGHNYPDQQVARMNKWGTSLVLYRSYSTHMEWYRPRLKCPMMFHPQSVNLDLFNKYETKKDIDVAFPGLVNPFYPFRCVAQKRLNFLKNNGLNVWMTWHPGYYYDMDKRREEFSKQGFPWREEYVEMLNRSRILVNSGGRFNDCVRKYFEGMAARCLVLGPLPAIPELYHFIDGYNLVEAHEFDWEAKMQTYLANDKRRRRITDAAYETVRKYHTVKVRIRELLGIFEDVLSGGVSKD